jgi:hypothetical protein
MRWGMAGVQDERERRGRRGRRKNSGGPFFGKKAPPDPLQKTFNMCEDGVGFEWGLMSSLD